MRLVSGTQSLTRPGHPARPSIAWSVPGLLTRGHGGVRAAASLGRDCPSWWLVWPVRHGGCSGCSPIASPRPVPGRCGSRTSALNGGRPATTSTCGRRRRFGVREDLRVLPLPRQDLVRVGQTAGRRGRRRLSRAVQRLRPPATTPRPCKPSATGSGTALSLCLPNAGGRACRCRSRRPTGRRLLVGHLHAPDRDRLDRRVHRARPRLKRVGAPARAARRCAGRFAS